MFKNLDCSSGLASISYEVQEQSSSYEKKIEKSFDHSGLINSDFFEFDLKDNFINNSKTRFKIIRGSSFEKIIF